LINKIDLLKYTNFNLKESKANARRIHPDLDIIDISCVTGEGIEEWMAWLSGQYQKKFGSKTRTWDSNTKNISNWAYLNLEITPVVGRFRKCQEEFVMKDYCYLYTKCGSEDIQTVSGTELLVKDIEVE
jgi:hypothetical protein